MVRDSLEALVKEDLPLAWRATKDDERVDELTEQIFQELLTYMSEDLKTIEGHAAALYLPSTSRGSPTTP